MKGKKLLWLLPVLIAVVMLALLLGSRTNEKQKAFLAKADLLKANNRYD